MIPFLKMHGAGNDFVIMDACTQSLPKLDWKKLADRHFGIGCDQIVIMEKSAKADVFMRIYNADGGEVASCGNATRCVGWLLSQEPGARSQKLIYIETLAGIISAEVQEDGQVSVDMGEPCFKWREIPLAREVDTLHLPIEGDVLKDPVAVSMGNPHMVFFVPDLDAVALDRLGPPLETHPLFPERANVNVAQVLTKDSIKLKVYERGAGLTLACGTGACATLVAAHRCGLTGRKAKVHLPGGTLEIEWLESNHMMMTGPVAVSFSGTFEEKDFIVI